MKHQKFFICKHCGNLLSKINDAGVPLVCCGENMMELTPNTTDASTEKHVPVVKVEGNKLTVDVGSVAHPMLPEHFIQFVYLQTEKGGQRKSLLPNEAPHVTFVVDDDKPQAVFEYCNIHGLWVTDL